MERGPGVHKGVIFNGTSLLLETALLAGQTHGLVHEERGCLLGKSRLLLKGGIAIVGAQDCVEMEVILCPEEFGGTIFTVVRLFVFHFDLIDGEHLVWSLEVNIHHALIFLVVVLYFF